MEEKSIQSRGGKARAQKLTSKERSEIAGIAAAARWNIPKATHEGTLQMEFGKFKIPCAVLEDGTRVLTQGGFLTTIGRSRTPKAGTGVTVAEVPSFLSANNLKSFVDKELLESTKPIRFALKGRTAIGYRAELLPKVCEVYLDARSKIKLSESQSRIAARCELIVRGLAHVGIIALVDEATGYQEIRDRLALQKILDQYLLKEYAKWAKRFPDEFYRLMFQLNNWEWNVESVKRPGVVGKYTNNLVYERLAPGVLEQLRKLNPKNEQGKRKAKHHQYLTEDVGHPALQQHLYMLIGIMRTSKTWDSFLEKVDRAMPRLGHTIPLPLDFGD